MEVLTHRQKDCAMNNLLNVSAPAPQTKPRFPRLKRLLRVLAANLERARTRRLLGQLNDQQLSDLGISHADRLNELDKPFWR
jgi:uncharacterized protein YjiS (DUF1127 family)